MEANAFKESIQKALDAGKKRKFTQKIDLAINFRGLDFKKPENRVEAEVLLPNAFRTSLKVCVFAKDKAFASQLEGIAGKVILADNIPSLSKKEVKGLAGSFDIFYAEAPAMVLVGKHLGQILAPRGKMPKPVPSSPEAVNALVQRQLRTVSVSNKRGKFMPVVHTAIGTEDMPLEKIAENALAVYNAVIGKLEKGEINVKSVFVKSTMGPSFKVGAVEGKTAKTAKDSKKPALKKEAKARKKEEAKAGKKPEDKAEKKAEDKAGKKEEKAVEGGEGNGSQA